MKSNVNNNGGAEYIRIVPWTLFFFCVSNLPIIGLLFCVGYSDLYNFEVVNETHCQVSYNRACEVPVSFAMHVRQLIYLPYLGMELFAIIKCRGWHVGTSKVCLEMVHSLTYIAEILHLHMLYDLPCDIYGQVTLSTSTNYTLSPLLPPPLPPSLHPSHFFPLYLSLSLSIPLTFSLFISLSLPSPSPCI